jgi:hypothetical protein
MRAELINARSSVAHVRKLRLLCSKYHFVFIEVTETFFRDAISNACVSMDGYSLIRCDRSHGCLYVSKGIKFEVFYKLGSGALKCLLVRLSIESLSLLVGVFYKAPSGVLQSPKCVVFVIS